MGEEEREKVITINLLSRHLRGRHGRQLAEGWTDETDRCSQRETDLRTSHPDTLSTDDDLSRTSLKESFCLRAHRLLVTQ